ncbi:MAG: YggS family pyridoxal phosphate-dependent enzyme [Woeseiaceae bacterium]|nr:YggS family pyridoxal phosphate-dependent enzyme [Woeseiaceae bacterium]
MGVTANLPKIRDFLAKAAVDAGRDTDTVRLLAVSKKQPQSSVIEAVAAGQLEFGENQVAEGVEKINSVANDELIWHFIGHLQTNKTRAVAEHFHWVHSVDRLKIAARLSQQRPDSLGDLNICLQINVDEEESKSGIPANAVRDLAWQVLELPRLRLRGLMCLPAIRHDFDAQRVPFARLSRLADQLRANGIPTDTLSMGMSGDYRAAIFEGSTMVRIGTAIFGPRGKA